MKIFYVLSLAISWSWPNFIHVPDCPIGLTDWVVGIGWWSRLYTSKKEVHQKLDLHPSKITKIIKGKVLTQACIGKFLWFTSLFHVHTLLLVPWKLMKNEMKTAWLGSDKTHHEHMVSNRLWDSGYSYNKL